MSEKEINLEKVLLAKFGCASKNQLVNNFSLEEAYPLLLESMKLSCELSLNLASENVDHAIEISEEEIYIGLSQEINNSILDTINQVV